MKRKLLQSNLTIFTLMLFCVTCFNTFGQQVKKISVQGFLKDGTGKAVTDGNQEITFKLYSTETGGTAAWTGTQIIKVTGGVYSAYLGTAANPIDALNWGISTYFVGVTIGTDELTPRTELTFAPYSLGSPKAQEVVCSGATGDIKYSILNPTQFAAVNGNCWVPMDGRSMSGSKLAGIIGGSNVPNAGGLFIRSQEFSNSGDYDPERSSGSTIAQVQSESYLSHGHSGSTNTIPDHSHSGTTDNGGAGIRASLINSGGTIPVIDASESHKHTFTTNPAGSHSHTVSINVNGGNETRPDNMNLWTYIRIN